MHKGNFNLLDTRKKELVRLLDKTPPCNASQTSETRVPLTNKRVLDKLKQRLDSGESDKKVVKSLIEMRIGELEASARVCRSHRG